MRGSLKNVTVVNGDDRQQGFTFSLLNPPVPLGGNVVSLDIYVDELPVRRDTIFIATSDEVVNAATLSENRPISFKPYQSARFLIINDDESGSLKETAKHRILIMSKLEGFEEITIPFTFTDYISGYQKDSSSIHITPDLLAYNESAITSGDTMFKNFTNPLILSGKKAYIVCSSNGALSANWNWMGVRYDNGGLYVPPARSFGRIIVEVSMDDGVRKRLPNFALSSRHEHGVITTYHDLAGLHVQRRLCVPFENRGFIMEIKMGMKPQVERDLRPTKRKVPRKVRFHFLIDGNITSYGLAAIAQSNSSKFNKQDNCLEIGSARHTKKDKIQYFGAIGVMPRRLKPSKILTDSFDNDLELSYDLQLQEGKTINLALIGVGSFSSAEECLREFRFMRDNCSKLVLDTEDSFKKHSSSTLTIRSSSAEKKQNQNLQISKLIRAYEKAKTSFQYLKAEYDGLGQGICAGLPRFPNYWARDTGWSLRGYLAVGDYRFSRSVIDNFFKHQARNATKGAVRGELPMIISGKAFLHSTTYGSADSTFLFPWAIKEYLLATGDVQYLHQRWESIQALVECGLLKDIDGDGLVDHGFTGTAEKLPIRDSTWMDHIDRRKSANDVQALFYESLKIGSELADIVGDNYNHKRWRQKAEQLAFEIDQRYWNADAEYYFDTIRMNGSKDPSIRPNALVLLLTGATSDPHKARSVLERVEQEDMTTGWGVRTLSSLDPKYHPALYHDGAVWPLVTGWAALAEIKLGRSEQALYYVNCMAERILAENGMFAETYRGDKPDPFNSCILQAWSISMYIHALREMMLGMKLNMLENKISFKPQIAGSLLQEYTHFAFEHTINGKGRFQASVDPYNRKILVMLKDWIGAKPEFFADSSYDVDVLTAGGEGE
ncbi:MAG: amylo-alpha-1,6-glucosidase [Nitrososphaera sp.]